MSWHLCQNVKLQVLVNEGKDQSLPVSPSPPPPTVSVLASNRRLISCHGSFLAFTAPCLLELSQNEPKKKSRLLSALSLSRSTSSPHTPRGSAPTQDLDLSSLPETIELDWHLAPYVNLVVVKAETLDECQTPCINATRAALERQSFAHTVPTRPESIVVYCPLGTYGQGGNGQTIPSANYSRNVRTYRKVSARALRLIRIAGMRLMI